MNIYIVRHPNLVLSYLFICLSYFISGTIHSNMLLGNQSITWYVYYLIDMSIIRSPSCWEKPIYQCVILTHRLVVAFNESQPVGVRYDGGWRLMTGGQASHCVCDFFHYFTQSISTPLHFCNPLSPHHSLSVYVEHFGSQMILEISAGIHRAHAY